MVRPVMPIIEYYANYDYIATELCENKDKPYLECNGKCYLEKQLKLVNHSNHNHESTLPQINLEDYPISPVEQFTFQIKEFNQINSECLFDYTSSSQLYLNAIFKPPQLIS